MTATYSILLFFTFFSSPPYEACVDATVISVPDGDTVKCDIEGWPDVVGKGILVRIYGIDTPEIHSVNPSVKQKAIEARDEVKKLLEKCGYQVKLENLRRDKYFRLNADVIANDVSIGPHLLKKKLARPYKGGKKEPYLKPIPDIK